MKRPVDDDRRARLIAALERTGLSSADFAKRAGCMGLSVQCVCAGMLLHPNTEAKIERALQRLELELAP